MGKGGGWGLTRTKEEEMKRQRYYIQSSIGGKERVLTVRSGGENGSNIIV